MEWSNIAAGFLVGAGLACKFLNVILVMLAVVIGVTFPIWGLMLVAFVVVAIGTAVGHALGWMQ